MPAPPLEIKWLLPLASSSGLDFSSGRQSDSRWAYRPTKVCQNCQCNWTQTQTFLLCHHLSCDGSDSNKLKLIKISLPNLQSFIQHDLAQPEARGGGERTLAQQV